MLIILIYFFECRANCLCTLCSVQSDLLKHIQLLDKIWSSSTNQMPVNFWHTYTQNLTSFGTKVNLFQVVSALNISRFKKSVSKKFESKQIWIQKLLDPTKTIWDLKNNWHKSFFWLNQIFGPQIFCHKLFQSFCSRHIFVRI